MMTFTPPPAALPGSNAALAPVDLKAKKEKATTSVVNPLATPTADRKEGKAPTSAVNPPHPPQPIAKRRKLIVGLLHT